MTTEKIETGQFIFITQVKLKARWNKGRHADGYILKNAWFSPLKHNFLSHTRDTIPTVQKLYCLNVKSSREEREKKTEKEGQQDKAVTNTIMEVTWWAKTFEDTQYNLFLFA